jgi:hypothetical protein
LENVDRVRVTVTSLIETYKITEKNGLGESDLSLRRAKLSEDEIDMIMQAIKLVALCIERGFITKGKRLDPSLLGRGIYTPQSIAKCDIFHPCDEAKLIPDKPPQLQIACLPGTNRRPIRAWQLMSVEEQNLELCVACTLDVVLETAIEEGVAVPEPEDVDVLPTICPLRSTRWATFRMWYAGQEGIEKVPGAGVPTLARVLVAETWEARVIQEDFTVLDAMAALNTSFTDEARDFHVARKREVNAYLLLSTSESASATENAGGKSDSALEKGKSGLASSQSITTIATKPDQFTPPPRKVKDEVHVAYEQSLVQNTGIAIRMDMLRYYVDSIVRARTEEAMRLLWPPGPCRLSHQFIFPRLGLVVPGIEMPKKRIRLFPSRKKESYTHATIAGWYTDLVLDEDDNTMIEQEAEARRRQAYLEWLALEGERMEYVFCYTIALPSFLVCDVSLSLSLINLLLPVCFSDMT